MNFWNEIGLTSKEDSNRLRNEVELLKKQNHIMAEKLDNYLLQLKNNSEKNELIFSLSEMNFELINKNISNLTNNIIKKNTELYSLINEQGSNIEKEISNKSDCELKKINQICEELKKDVFLTIEKYDNDRKKDISKIINTIKAIEESVRLLLVNNLLDHMSEECLKK